MTIYVPVWLYWYGGMPLALIVGYLLGRLHKPAAVPPDPYRDVRDEMRERLDKVHAEHEAKRAREDADKEAKGGASDEEREGRTSGAAT